MPPTKKNFKKCFDKDIIHALSQKEKRLLFGHDGKGDRKHDKKDDREHDKEDDRKCHKKDDRKCHKKDNKKSTCDLRVDFRELWGIHGIYTKFVIDSVMAEIPNVELLVARLLRNQDEIGDFVKPFVGVANGNELARLLREHIAAAGAAIIAVKEGDQEAIDAAVAALFANSTEVSALISSFNPDKLPFEEVKRLFDEHVQFVIDMTVATNSDQFELVIQLFDAYYHHILEFADFVLQGILPLRKNKD